MLHRTGSHALGVVLIVPDICRIMWFNWVSMIEFDTGAQNSPVEKTSDSALVLRTSAVAPQDELASFCMILFLVLTLDANFCRCSLKVKVRSSVTPRYFGVGLCFSTTPSDLICSCWFASLLFRYFCFPGLGCKLHFLKYSLIKQLSVPLGNLANLCLVLPKPYRLIISFISLLNVLHGTSLCSFRRSPSFQTVS